ncbi:MAG: GNAT family N-acetyltransferase [Pseudomonadota bacterium]|nr:GNAT family N-acetyltransferase [Pseudomonadota bacterium]
MVLHEWAERHRQPFAAMHADPAVMLDQGGPIDRQTSDMKFDRYRRALEEHGLSRWAVEAEDGTFLGYAGAIFQANKDHPLGPHTEIGWRFTRRSWGHGYATESAKAALKHAFEETDLKEILAYTTAENHRSQAVMRRLGLEREPSRDFTTFTSRVGAWCGLVWVAARDSYQLGEPSTAEPIS